MDGAKKDRKKTFFSGKIEVKNDPIQLLLIRVLEDRALVLSIQKAFF